MRNCVLRDSGRYLEQSVVPEIFQKPVQILGIQFYPMRLSERFDQRRARAAAIQVRKQVMLFRSEFEYGSSFWNLQRI